jgi:hypothetical protein
MVLLSVAQGCSLDCQAIARLRRWWVCLRWTSAPSTPRAAGVYHNTLVYGMIPPGLGPVTSPALPPMRIRRDGRFGIRLTGKPAGLSMLDVLHDGCGFFRLRSALRRCWLLRKWARRPHDKAEGLVSYPPFTVLHLPLSEHPLPLPAAGCCVLRPARWLHEEGHGGLLLAPRFECLAHGTGTRA